MLAAAATSGFGGLPMAGTKDARGRDVLENCMLLDKVADVLDMCQEELQQLETNRVAASVARKLDTVAESTRKTAADTVKKIGWDYAMKHRKAEQHDQRKSHRAVLGELKQFNQGLTRPASGRATHMDVDGSATGKRKDPLSPNDMPELLAVRSLRPRTDESLTEAALRQLPPPDNDKTYTARTAVYAVWNITAGSGGGSYCNTVSQRSIIEHMIDRKLIPISVKCMEKRMRIFRQHVDNLSTSMPRDDAVKTALNNVHGFNHHGKPFTTDRSSFLQWAQKATHDDRALTTEDIEKHLMQCKQTTALMKGQVSAACLIRACLMWVRSWFAGCDCVCAVIVCLAGNQLGQATGKVGRQQLSLTPQGQSDAQDTLRSETQARAPHHCRNFCPELYNIVDYGGGYAIHTGGRYRRSHQTSRGQSTCTRDASILRDEGISWDYACGSRVAHQHRCSDLGCTHSAS